MVERRCVGGREDSVEVDAGHGVKELRDADEGAAEVELRSPR